MIDHKATMAPQQKPASENATAPKAPTTTEQKSTPVPVVPAATQQKPTSGFAAEPQQNLDAGVLGLSPTIAAAAEKAALQAPVDQLLHQPDARKGVISLYAGKSHKQFDFHIA
jgi:hypothetical protein